MKVPGFLANKFSVYLAIVGILSGIVLMEILGKPDPLPRPVAMPAVNPYHDAIAASGIVESLDRNIAIGTAVAGLVKHVDINVGDAVKKGDLLFEIDDRDLAAQLLVEKANQEVSKANLQRLQDQLERLKSVKDPRAVSVDEVKTRQNDVAIAEAQYIASQAKVKQTEILLDRLKVFSPKNGIILQNNIREGEFLPLNGSPPPILLGDGRMQVRVDIDEQNASRFDPSEIAVAYPKNNTVLKIPLTFDRIEPYVIPKHSLTGSGEERVDTRVLQVIYSFDPPQSFKMYVGQQVDVFIQNKPRSRE